MEIYSRKPEQQQLSEILKRDRATFLAIYGRRRIGKTYLIRNFFIDKGTFFHITGVNNEKLFHQLHHFAQETQSTFGSGDDQQHPNSWDEAFERLQTGIQNCTEQGRIIIFLDELPWLATHKSGFIQALTYYWNRHWENDHRIILSICGSAASWMIKNVIDNKGGLYGRLTHQIKLMPFNLRETQEYLQCRGVILDHRQVAELYMATGGVAKYLDLVVPGKSSAQVIQQLFFSKEAQSLSHEYDRLFQSLFKDSNHHHRVVQLLVKKSSGLSRTELNELAKLKSVSVQQRVLKELIESGFISEMQPFGAKKKGSIYRLSDEFSLFSLRWKNEMNDPSIVSQSNYWLSLHRTPAWRAWAGFAFERLCFNHIPEILKSLGINGMHCKVSGWRFRPEPDSGEKGAQIDLVIDRPDHCIHLCEIKFSEEPYRITSSYADELQHKVRCFREQTKTRKTLFLTLMTSCGVASGAEKAPIHSEVVLKDFFI